MIWTRLAPKPNEPDGGMSGLRTAVPWEVAEDEAFARIVKSGTSTAAPELGYSVHVDVDGLQPDRVVLLSLHAAGRVRAPRAGCGPCPAPAPDALSSSAFASCQHFETGLFTAYDHMAREDVDLVAHLGDYIYEYGAERDDGAEVRDHRDPNRRSTTARRYAQTRATRRCRRRTPLPVDR